VNGQVLANTAEVERMCQLGYEILHVCANGTTYMYAMTPERHLTTIMVPPAACPAFLPVMPDGCIKALWNGNGYALHSHPHAGDCAEQARATVKLGRIASQLAAAA
jgi:hypothetical protein